MQQTNQYKLNLIEKADTFSPDPLNENAEKVEALLAAEAQARSDADAAETQARSDADAAEAQVRADAVAAEIQNRTAAVAAEAKARADADAAEASARQAADDTEAQTRAAAVAAETKARTDAIAAEAKTRADADTAETNARKSADTAEANARAALDNRVKVLEAHKIAWGYYAGNGANPRTFSVGFTPSVVIVFGESMSSTITGMAVADHSISCLSIVAGGFQVGPVGQGIAFNVSGSVYTYAAIV